MKDNRFKKGDRVYDIRYGWGNVAESHINFHIKVYFDSEKSAFWFDEISSRILSFSEYALDGYTAFRPEELPDKGDLVWVRDIEYEEEWQIALFVKKENNLYITTRYNPFDGNNFLYWKEMTTKNPYENEQ
jgi:hypothetical protein